MRKNLIFAALALAGLATLGFTPTRHDNSYTTNGVTYAQRGGLGSADYVVTNVALSASDVGAASVSDATLTDASAWRILHTPLTDEQKAAFYEESQDAAQNDYAVTIRTGVNTDLSLYVGEAYVADLSVSADGLTASFVGGSPEAQIVWGPYGTTVATRVALQGYVLGEQTSKPLASEAEAAALRTALTLIAPDWSPSTYQQYDVVKYNGGYYYALTSVDANYPPIDTTKWASLTNLAALAHQFLPLTGGLVNGDITFLSEAKLILKGAYNIISPEIIFTNPGNGGGNAILSYDGDMNATDHYVLLPTSGGTLALLSQIGIPAFSTTATYALGAKVVYNNALWNCTTAVSTAGAWNASNWTKVCDLSTDATPTANSKALMTSGDIKTALDTRVRRSEALTDGFTVFTTSTINGHAGNFRYYPTETTNVWALYARDNNGVYQPIGAGSLFSVCRLVWVASVAQWRAGSSVEAASSSSMRDEEAGFDAASIVISSGSTTVFTLTRETTPVALKIDLAEKASLDSPTFTGSPTAPTAASGDNSTKLATTAFVQAAVGSSSSNPLSGQSFDFATMQGVFNGVKACIEALGGSVTNFPANN